MPSNLAANSQLLLPLRCRAGLGKEIPYEAESTKELHRLREGRNMELLRSLKDSEMTDSLMDSCRKDQNEGRMDVMRLRSRLHFVDLGLALPMLA